MKKIISIALVALMVAATAVSVSAADAQDIVVLKNTPTIDGVIEDGEWDSGNVIDVSADNTAIWSGSKINNDVVFFSAWDDKGLYVAADIKDASLLYAPDKNSVYSKDAFQIALDPGGLIGEKGEKGGAMFFSIGPVEKDGLGAVYHPYGGGSGDPFEYTGAYSLTDGGWQLELLIPWTSIEILGADGYAWKHGAGESVNVLICVLDRDADGDTCYGMVLEGAEAMSFKPAEYPLTFELSSEEYGVEEEAPATEAAGETVTATSTADPITALVALAIAGAGVVVCKKNRK